MTLGRVNFGKLAAGGLVLAAALAGAGLYYLQVYGYYAPVSFEKGAEITLTDKVSGEARAVAVSHIEGIDAESSPLRFRACLTLVEPAAQIEAAFTPYVEPPVPLNGPSWFDCYDAEKIGRALETGAAKAFLARGEIRPGVDRVMAVFPDGQAFAWHQLNSCGEARFNRRETAADCPTYAEEQ